MMILKIFNYRFKHPYKIFSEDEIEEINKENFIISKDTNQFIFKEGKKQLIIYETLPNSFLSPKVKIQRKAIEQYEVDKYYISIFFET